VTERRRARRSRRRFLRGAPAVAAGVLGGCTALSTGDDASGSKSADDPEPVSVLAAGSLQVALSEGLAPAVDVPVRVESRGSASLARLIAADKRDPDLASVADTALFESVLRPPWYAVFASNAVVLAYNRKTEGGRRIRDAGRENWYAPLLAENVALGRTDPDRDPLGYRTLFALELASRYYDDAADLRAAIPARGQIYPETSLLSRFETGALDAAVVYRNMAVERGYDYLDLPTQIDLSAPEHVEEWYSTVSYTLP